MAIARDRRKPRKAARTEAEVLAQVLEAARLLGLDLARRNTGAGLNPRGRLVRFGTPGDSDLAGTLPDGRTLHVEVKREGFDPEKLRGAKREHFDRQLERLRKTSSLGGVAFWCDDAAEFLLIVRHVLRGARVHEPGCGAPIVSYPRS